MITKNSFAGLLALTCLLIGLTTSGCVCFGFGTPADIDPTPQPWPIDEPGIPTVAPTAVPAWPTGEPGTPGTPGTTPAPVATVTPTPVSGAVDAEMVGYGTDKDTYSRGDTATCDVDIKNTGEVPIDKVEFIVNVFTTRPIIGTIHAIKNQEYVVDQLDIQPGETEKVAISVLIPSTYQGVSTAGDYRFEIVVRIGDEDIGSFSKEVKVV